MRALAEELGNKADGPYHGTDGQCEEEIAEEVELFKG